MPACVMVAAGEWRALGRPTAARTQEHLDGHDCHRRQCKYLIQIESMFSMTVRSVSPGLAPLLELLELEQPRVLTVAGLAEYAHQAGVDWPTNVIAQRLRERGWLLPLSTRGVWEFAPAARAGAYGSGDPLIELRAVLARDPDTLLAVAAESAAYFHGLSSRRPETECISVPAGIRPPKSLGAYRVVRWIAATPPVRREGLPVWSIATILAFMASRPAGYHDWPNVGEWLVQAASAVEVDELMAELVRQSAGSWARAAYLLARGEADSSARALMRHAPKGVGPHYLGDRRVPGRHHAVYDVVDSTGFEVSSA